MAATVFFLVDACSELALAAARSAILQFGSVVALQHPPHPPLRLGVCGLRQQQSSMRPQVHVKLRPEALVLSNLHAAVGRLGRAEQALEGSQVPAALLNLINLLSKHAAGEPGSSGAQAGLHTLVLLTDRRHQSDDFRHMLEVSKPQPPLPLLWARSLPCPASVCRSARTRAWRWH